MYVTGITSRTASPSAGGAPGSGVEVPGDRRQDAAAAAGAAPQLVIDLTEDDAAAAGCAGGDFLPISSQDRFNSCSAAGCNPSPAGQGSWACAACTLVNSERNSTCAACGGAHPAAGGPGHGSGGGGSSGSRKQPGTAVGIRLGLGGASSSGEGGAVWPGSASSGSRKQGGAGISGVRVGLGVDSGSTESTAAAASPHSQHSWCCRFCTLHNAAAYANCGACGQWRFSSGAPTASRPTVEQKM